MGENPCNIFDKLIKSTLNFFGYNNIVSTYSQQQEEEEEITSVVYNFDRDEFKI